jgi:hypothetical protein
MTFDAGVSFLQHVSYIEDTNAIIATDNVEMLANRVFSATRDADYNRNYSDGRELANIFGFDFRVNEITLPVDIGMEYIRSQSWRTNFMDLVMMQIAMVKQIDIAYAGNNIFLNKAELTSNNAIIEINSDYHIELNDRTSVKIININDDSKFVFKDKIYPNDNSLNLIISGRNPDNTFITSNHLKLSGSGKIILDESIAIPLPSEIGIIPQKINIIVGKNRSFN